MSGWPLRRAPPPSMSFKLHSVQSARQLPIHNVSPNLSVRGVAGKNMSQNWATVQLSQLADEIVSAQPNLSKLQLLTSILLQALTEHTAGLANGMTLAESLAMAIHSKKHILQTMLADSRNCTAHSGCDEAVHRQLVVRLHPPARALDTPSCGLRLPPHGLHPPTRRPTGVLPQSGSSHSTMLSGKRYANRLGNVQENEIGDSDDQDGDGKSDEEVQVMDYSDNFDNAVARRLQSHITPDPALLRVSSSSRDRSEPCYTCRRCAVLYAWRRHLEMHFAEHRTAEKPFLCHICGKTFTRADHLNRHSLSHHLDWYGCQLCGLEFSRASQLDRHWRSAHEIDWQKDTEGSNPTSPVVSDKESDVAGDELPEGFDFASVSSRDMNELEKKALASSHLSLTGDEDVVTARVAPVFHPPSPAVDSLHGHLQRSVPGSQVHSSRVQLVDNQLSVSTNVCTENTSTSTSRSSNSPYQAQRQHYSHCCNTCGRTFDRVAHLRRHLRIHSGERPFSCPFCAKKCSRGDYLRAHLITQHNKNRVRCNFCDKVFSTISAVRLHECPVAVGGKLRTWYLQSTFVDVQIDGKQLQDTVSATRLAARLKLAKEANASGEVSSNDGEDVAEL